MSAKPEQPGKSLIPYNGQMPTGEHDHFLHGMAAYPGGLARAHTMKLATSIPPDKQSESVFTGWSVEDTSANTLALSSWLRDYGLQHVRQRPAKGEPPIVTGFYDNLRALQIALVRASVLAPDPLRDFFPASFEMPFARYARGQEGRERDPLSMLADLEQLKRELQKLAKFPDNTSIASKNRRGIEEFRQIVKRRLIVQVDRAIEIETQAIAAMEARLPQGETPEAASYRKTVEDKVATWLDVVSNRPSSGRMRGE